MAVRRPFLAFAAAFLFLGPLASGGAAAGSLAMDARVLLQGHARVGSWMAIEVRLENSGPAVSGELRIAGGSQGRTTFGMPVDLPTDSRKVYVLHAQPPAFGRTIKVELVANGSTLATRDVAYLVHDATQLVVGIVAEKPAAIIPELDLQPSLQGSPAIPVALSIGDLPERVEGWAPLDRLVWQDVDSDQLSTQQLAALRGWLAGGGKLVIVGGTAGIGTLSGFPDDLLPYRPAATVDIPSGSIAAFVENLPSDAPDLPAMAGTLAHGRSLVVSGDRTVAAEMSYGSGSVTVLGFDPATPWLAETKGVEGLWRRFLPIRTAAGSATISDDSQLISAVSQTPSLALPPAGGLLLLLAAYIVIIGPVNYLVLKRLDRRELAWITMPVLVVGFAAVAYAYGGMLRGTDVLLNEVAIVRGAPDVTEGSAQVYVGIFSPVRGSYQVDVPGGALLASPINGDFFGTGQNSSLDVIQGDPARVRDLAVGFSSLRTIRADAPASVPLVRTSFALKDGIVSGTLENGSDQTLEQVAVVVGGSVAVVGKLAPHASTPVRITLGPNQFGQPLADRIVGQNFSERLDDDAQRRNVRYSMLSQLTYDPNFGNRGQLDADGPVVIAFGRESVIDVTVRGQEPRRSANVLYYIPSQMAVSGHVLFQSDLIRATPVSADAQMFMKDPTMMGFGVGSIVMAYRPIAYQGTLTATDLQLSMNAGGAPAFAAGAGTALKPLPSIPVGCTDATNAKPEGCTPRILDGLAEVELWDRSPVPGPSGGSAPGGQWVRLPHLTNGTLYAIEEPGRYVDPTSGQVLVRFVNDNPDGGVGFSFQVGIGGDIE